MPTRRERVKSSPRLTDPGKSDRSSRTYRTWVNGSAAPMQSSEPSPPFPSLTPKSILPTAPPPLSGNSRSSSPARVSSSSPTRPSSANRRSPCAQRSHVPSEGTAVLSMPATARPSSMPGSGRPTTSPPPRPRTRADPSTPREPDPLQRPLTRVQATCRKGVLHSSAGLGDGPGGTQVPRATALQPAPGESAPDVALVQTLLAALRQQPPFDMVGDATLTALVPSPLALSLTLAPA